MTFEWAAWGPALAVLALGLVAGLLWALNQRTDARVAGDIASTGHREDLAQAKTAALDGLRALELERDKLSAEAYQAQRNALLASGAAAMRELDEGAPAEDPVRAALEAQRATLGDARVDAALAALDGEAPRSATIAPAWQGAAWMLGGVVVLLGLFLWARDNAVTRNEGASMTGNQDLGGGESMTVPDPSGARAMWEARLAQDPDDTEALNALTEAALADQDLGTAMALNTRARQLAPDHPDTRVHFAFLRMAIGQSDEAMAELDSVIAEHPDHTKALVYKGLLAMAMDRPDLAVPALEKAVAGGAQGNSEIEAALARARMLLDGRGESATPLPAPTGAAVVIEGTATLDPSLAAQLTGSEVLYVSVRDPAGGPPLAALRLPPGPFPLPFRVTTANAISMGGTPRPFPEALDVSVRIDIDGNAATRSDAEPAWTGRGVKKGATDVVAALQ